ncbi:MAG: glycosyltransferase, partial [Bdellovibrionota bacterium]
MNRPLVSVIINCYNGEAFLRQAIDSVLAQTYDNWEVIFWDNQSTDRSAEIFRSYSDPRLKYHYAPTHCLLYDSRNQALAHANGDLLAFLDVDDWWLPEKLVRQVALFDDPEVGLASTNYLVRNEIKGREWVAFKQPMPSGYVLNDLLRSYSVALLTLMIRRSALPIGETPFDPRYHIIGDFDRVLRQAAHWKLARLHDVLAVYRIHGNNETSKRRARHISELETWQNEMAEVPAIGGQPNFRWVSLHTTYIKTMDALLPGRRREAYGHSMTLPWGS